MSSIPQETSELAAAAVQYAGSGQVPIPLETNGKRPIIRNWHRWQPGADHERRVRAIWTGHPSANVGLRTGKGLVVVDVDPRHGGTVDPSWPATLTVKTRGGGWHLYYGSSAPVRCSASRVAPGVDVRGDGGYVVAPPSPGWEYTNDLPVAELPVTLRIGDDGPRAGSAGVGTPAGWQAFEIVEEVPAGERNSYMAALAGWLFRQGVSPGEAESLMLDFNLVACDPPLEDREVSGILKSIARYHR